MVEDGRPVEMVDQWPLTRMAVGAVALRLAVENQEHDHSQLIIEADIAGYRNYRGVPVFGAWLWNSDLDIGAASEVDIEDALSGYSFIKSTVFWVLGFTLILTVGAVLLVLAFGERTHRVLNKARIDLEKKVLERTVDLEKNQEKLKASEEQSRLILSSVGEGLFGVDSTGCVTFINEAAVTMLGYKADNLMGQPVHDLIHHSHEDGSCYDSLDCPMEWMVLRRRGLSSLIPV